MRASGNLYVASCRGSNQRWYSFPGSLQHAGKIRPQFKANRDWWGVATYACVRDFKGEPC